MITTVTGGTAVLSVALELCPQWAGGGVHYRTAHIFGCDKHLVFYLHTLM